MKLDFAQPPALPRSRWLWALAAVAALSLLTAAWDAALHWQQLNAAQTRLAALEARNAPPAASPAAARAADPRSPERRNANRQDALQAQALRSLHLPWLPLLDAVERAAQAPVAVRQWSVDARFSRLQLQVESRNLPELFVYVEQLQQAAQRDAQGPLGSVQLLGHEWIGPPQQQVLRGRVAVSLRPQVGEGVSEALPPVSGVRVARAGEEGTP